MRYLDGRLLRVGSTSSLRAGAAIRRDGYYRVATASQARSLTTAPPMQSVRLRAKPNSVCLTPPCNCQARGVTPRRMPEATRRCPSEPLLGQHPRERFIHVRRRSGLAQRVLVVEPDLHDHLHRIRCKPEEQPIAIRHALLHAPPVGVLRAQRRAEPEVRFVRVRRHKLRDGAWTDASSFVLGGSCSPRDRCSGSSSA